MASWAEIEKETEKIDESKEKGEREMLDGGHSTETWHGFETEKSSLIGYTVL